MSDPDASRPVLGLRANLGQFVLLVAASALVGGTVGQERAVVPLLADRIFGLTAVTAAASFIVACRRPELRRPVGGEQTEPF